MNETNENGDKTGFCTTWPNLGSFDNVSVTIIRVRQRHLSAKKKLNNRRFLKLTGRSLQNSQIQMININT